MLKAGVLFEDADDGLQPDVSPSLECVHQTSCRRASASVVLLARSSRASRSLTEKMKLAFKKLAS